MYTSMNRREQLKLRQVISISTAKPFSFKSNDFVVSIENVCILFIESAIFAMVQIYLGLYLDLV